MEFATAVYDDTQLVMDGYDPDHYVELALIKPGENWSDPHFRHSYVAKTVTRRINKFINLPVLKHHQSAGVTIALNLTTAAPERAGSSCGSTWEYKTMYFATD